MVNWKTTLTGVVGFLVGGAAYMKWITAEQAGIISTIIIGILGVLAKDNDVTGGTRSQ